jgi:hypothetical protein
MAKADRLERLDLRRCELEMEYRQALVAALRRAAAGQWGLFEHNQDKRLRAHWAPTVDGLSEMGDAIDQMRDQLAMEPFALHREFLASRGPVASSAVGEPKQARKWLDRLESAGSADGE